ncbi:hypothetical protein LBMAG10_15690 [Actinomycetes bacterium]|nr:hypothetical protein LBMAG10_15690 [Actinomycetes bacterium]
MQTVSWWVFCKGYGILERVGFAYDQLMLFNTLVKSFITNNLLCYTNVMKESAIVLSYKLKHAHREGLNI